MRFGSSMFRYRRPDSFRSDTFGLNDIVDIVVYIHRSVFGEGLRMVLSVVPSAVEAFVPATAAAGEPISTAGSVNSAAMLGAVAAAVGPIGATYLAAYGPEQTSNLAGALLVGGVHAAIAEATEAANTAFTAADDL
jgi:hypothetical protein